MVDGTSGPHNGWGPFLMSGPCILCARLSDDSEGRVFFYGAGRKKEPGTGLGPCAGQIRADRENWMELYLFGA